MNKLQSAGVSAEPKLWGLQLARRVHIDFWLHLVDINLSVSPDRRRAARQLLLSCAEGRQPARGVGAGGGRQSAGRDSGADATSPPNEEQQFSRMIASKALQKAQNAL